MTPTHPPTKQTKLLLTQFLPRFHKKLFWFFETQIKHSKIAILAKIGGKINSQSNATVALSRYGRMPQREMKMHTFPNPPLHLLRLFDLLCFYTIIVIININHNVIHLVTKSDNVHLQRCHLKTYDDSNALWKCMNAAMLQYGVKCSSKVQCTNCVQK